jgi:hypothetical protein
MSYHTRPISDFGKPFAKAYHAIMNFMAFVLALSGVTVAFVNHQEGINHKVPGKVHLSSFHSWIGLSGECNFATDVICVPRMELFWPRGNRRKAGIATGEFPLDRPPTRLLVPQSSGRPDGPSVLRRSLSLLHLSQHALKEGGCGRTSHHQCPNRALTCHHGKFSPRAPFHRAHAIRG